MLDECVKWSSLGKRPPLFVLLGKIVQRFSDESFDIMVGY